MISYLPPSLTHLKFGVSFSKEKSIFPPSLLHLTLGYGFKKPSTLPPNLVYLSIHHLLVEFCNLPLSLETLVIFFENTIPAHHLNLKKLTCGYSFSDSIENFPPNLTHLEFGHWFNFNISNLPHSLTHLTFGETFNKVIRFDHSTTTNLIHLKFGKNFTQPVDDLPLMLHYLEFGLRFNCSVEKLPQNLRILRFSTYIFSEFNQPLPHLPYLQELYLGGKFSYWDAVPRDALRVLELNIEWPWKSVHAFPLSITHLTLGSSVDIPITHQGLEKGGVDTPMLVLPLSLTHLSLGLVFNQSVDFLPPNLVSLTFGFYFNQPVNSLPQSLQQLSFGSYFNQPVNSLPPQLTHLKLGEYFNQPIDKLPSSITHLHIFLGDNFTFNVVLPAQIQHVYAHKPAKNRLPIDTRMFPQKVKVHTS